MSLCRAMVDRCKGFGSLWGSAEPHAILFFIKPRFSNAANCYPLLVLQAGVGCCQAVLPGWFWRRVKRRRCGSSRAILWEPRSRFLVNGRRFSPNIALCVLECTVFLDSATPSHQNRGWNNFKSLGPIAFSRWPNGVSERRVPFSRVLNMGTWRSPWGWQDPGSSFSPQRSIGLAVWLGKHAVGWMGSLGGIGKQ